MAAFRQFGVSARQMIENKLLPRHFFGGYIFDIARRDPCRSLKLFESLVEALLALELQAFCESVPGISQFVFRWIAAGRGGRTLRTGQQQGVRLVRAEAKCCERQHRGKQYPQTHAQIVTGNSDEKEISIGRVYLRVYVGTGGHELRAAEKLGFGWRNASSVAVCILPMMRALAPEVTGALAAEIT